MSLSVWKLAISTAVFDKSTCRTTHEIVSTSSTSSTTFHILHCRYSNSPAVYVGSPLSFIISPYYLPIVRRGRILLQTVVTSYLHKDFFFPAGLRVSKYPSLIPCYVIPGKCAYSTLRLQRQSNKVDKWKMNSQITKTSYRTHYKTRQYNTNADFPELLERLWILL